MHRYRSNLTYLPLWTDNKSIELRNNMLRHDFPPYLISYGGSGNTYTRLLIEYTTKIWTGSMYHGEFQAERFYGSKKCLTEVIVTKVHGEHIRDIDELIKGECLCGCGFYKSANTKYFRSVYHRTDITVNEVTKQTYPKAIFIIRNPWHSLFGMLCVL